MKIYFEFIIFINFLLDFLILYGTKRLLKKYVKIKRLILGSLFGSLTTVFLFINISKIVLFIIKIIISIIIIIIAFGKEDFKNSILYFYIISIILGGTIYLFNIKNYIEIIILIFGSPLIIYIITKELINYKNIYSNKYNVTIYIKNKKYNLEGFIDTGNKLTSPIKKLPVILVNLKINSNKILYVPYKALNTEGIIPCIKPDKVIIEKKEFKNCLIGLAKEKFEINGLNCILPNKFKEIL